MAEGNKLKEGRRMKADGRRHDQSDSKVTKNKSNTNPSASFRDPASPLCEAVSFRTGAKECSNCPLPLCPKGFPDGLEAVSFRAAFRSKATLRLSPDQQKEYDNLFHFHGKEVAINYRDYCLKQYNMEYSETDKFKICKNKKCSKKFYQKDVASVTIFDQQKFCCRDCRNKGRKF